ncbi:MAG: hypothetical protein DMG31_00115 [Acidobacteria bacterium]|nr:MAG: hypothetical protein DMG31_00115 [Acidobacteriota bacterium]
MMGAATEICPPEGGRYACKSEGEMAVTRLGLTRAIVSAAAVTATASLLFASAPRFARAPSRAQEQAQGSEADSKAIKQVFAEFYESFSRHDAHAAAMTFAEDADFTNMRGVHNHGRKEIEAHLAMIFAGNLGSARRTDMVKSIRFVTPAIAEVDADTVISGTKAADGSEVPPRKGLMVTTMTKQNGRWFISIFHEVEFPAAAPAR